MKEYVKLTIFNNVINSIVLLELRLINSIKSIDIKSKYAKLKIIKNEIKFSF